VAGPRAILAREPEAIGPARQTWWRRSVATGWPDVDPMQQDLRDADESRLIEALRMRDEAAFLALVDRYHASMVRLAQMYVHDQAQAEEVAQETWLGVLRGIQKFEGRSSLRTWLFRILTNIAKSRGRREARSIPFSALWEPDPESSEPAVEPERFLPADHPRWPRHWNAMLPSWSQLPEAHLVSQETRARLNQALTMLSPSQREVITLRDIEGWTSDEVCISLGISETNQRVLLHRARSKVRRALDAYFQEE
jgi:RNA polymerase sigma-70 factor, ECF subfamily